MFSPAEVGQSRKAIPAPTVVTVAPSPTVPTTVQTASSTAHRCGHGEGAAGGPVGGGSGSAIMRGEPYPRGPVHDPPPR